MFLVPAIALDWDNNNPIGRIVFAALAVLALGMVGRAWLARTTRPQDARYIEHVGFTLIALFDGFVIITAKDLGAPVWLLLVVAVAGVLAGRAAIARVIAGSSQHAAAS